MCTAADVGNVSPRLSPRINASNVAPERSKRVVDHAMKEVLLEHYFNWTQRSLLDDIAKHVHEVVRTGHIFHNEDRDAPFVRFLSSPKSMDLFRAQLNAGNQGRVHTSPMANDSLSVSMRASASTGQLANKNSSISSNSSGSVSSESFVSKMRNITGLNSLREKKANKHQKILSKDGALVSELRNVIVLFISMKMDSASVFVDPQHVANTPDTEHVTMVQTCRVDSFHFLSRTIKEVEADKKLINQFQSCMQVMTEVFHSKGGHMRQFIVDDKGKNN